MKKRGLEERRQKRLAANGGNLGGFTEKRKKRAYAPRKPKPVVHRVTLPAEGVERLKLANRLLHRIVFGPDEILDDSLEDARDYLRQVYGIKL